MTYANAYGQFSVLDNLCNYSFGATASGIPGPLAATGEAQIFGSSNGIPPTSGVNLINNAAPGGPKEDRLSTADQDLDNALCLRSLAQGRDAVTGAALNGAVAREAQRVEVGVEQIIASGNLRRIPSIFVAGRNDAILPLNFAARAYFGLNNVVEGSLSPLHCYDVTNAQHLDSFNQFPGYNALLVPLHRYFIQAMDLMFEHLRNGRPLPPSQVVHTTPRGVGAPPNPPRGMSRDEAARYIGVGVTKLDEMVADRRMPRPKRVDGRDRLQLEAAVTDLPDDKRINPLDRMLQAG